MGVEFKQVWWWFIQAGHLIDSSFHARRKWQFRIEKWSSEINQIGVFWQPVALRDRAECRWIRWVCWLFCEMRQVGFPWSGQTEVLYTNNFFFLSMLHVLPISSLECHWATNSIIFGLRIAAESKLSLLIQFKKKKLNMLRNRLERSK